MSGSSPDTISNISTRHTLSPITGLWHADVKSTKGFQASTPPQSPSSLPPVRLASPSYPVLLRTAAAPHTGYHSRHLHTKSTCKKLRSEAANFLLSTSSKERFSNRSRLLLFRRLSVAWLGIHPALIGSIPVHEIPGQNIPSFTFLSLSRSDLRDSRILRRSSRLGLHFGRDVLGGEMDGIMKRLEVDRRKTSDDEEFN